MKHIAKILSTYADDHKIIHIDAIINAGLRRLAKDEEVNPKIRKALYEIDPQLELLIPYQVDDHEKQLKRNIQNKMGTVVNLTKLKKDHPRYYRELLKYGSPADVLRKWGLGYCYNTSIRKEQFKDVLDKIASGGVVSKLYTNHRKLYKAICYQATKEGKTVREFIEGLGFKYNE